MFESLRWKSGTALLIALGMSSAVFSPVVAASPLDSPQFVSQLFGQSNRVVIPAGVTIPAVYEGAERIVVAPDETMEITLVVPDNITSNLGTILIPAGSEIQGQLEPVAEGTQFVADRLILTNGEQLPIEATSDPITQRERVDRGISGNSVLKGAAIGAGAATLLGVLTGDRAIATEEVLGGAGLGAIAGVFLGRKKAEVLVVDANADLELTLNADLLIR